PLDERHVGSGKPLRSQRLEFGKERSEMRALVTISPAILLALALGAGCTSREKVIVIREPAAAPDKPKEPTEGTDAPIATSSPQSDESDWGIKAPDDSRAYAQVITKVTSMPSDGDLLQRVARRGLSVVNVMWEDTGRAQGSALGPNISDF